MTTHKMPLWLLAVLTFFFVVPGNASIYLDGPVGASNEGLTYGAAFVQSDSVIPGPAPHPSGPALDIPANNAEPPPSASPAEGAEPESGDPTSFIPEPASLALLGSGLIALGMVARKKRASQ